MKFVPFAVRIKEELPTEVDVGDMDVSVGTRLKFPVVNGEDSAMMP